MKKHILIFILPLLFFACKKHKDSLLPQDFKVTISRVQAQRARVEIFPEYEFTRYHAELKRVSDYELLFPTDEAYIRYTDSSLHAIANLYFEGDMSYALFHGTMFQTYTVPPSTDYYVLIYSYNGDRPIPQLRKERFRTLDRKLTDFHLDSVVMQGENIYVYPNPQSPAPTYYWDFGVSREFNLAYAGIPSYYFYTILDGFYVYDLISDALSCGNDEDRWSVYYSDAEYVVGDTLTLLAVGYDPVTGETTDRYESWWLIRPEDAQERVHAIPAEEDLFESMFMPFWPDPIVPSDSAKSKMANHQQNVIRYRKMADSTNRTATLPRRVKRIRTNQ